MKLIVAILLACVACSNERRSEPAREPEREPERQRRLIEPPPSRAVRALPPHAIRAEGVGPYKLGATVAMLLDELPSGPRITQFTLPGVIRRDILRAEDDAILIGAEPQGRATFISVVQPDVARTESGVQVGSTRAELERALGQPVVDPERALDPRVVIPSGLRNARVVIEENRVAAIVLVAETPRVADSKDPGKEPVKEAKDGKSRSELVRTSGDELAVVSRETDKPLAKLIVPGLVFAALVRNPSDGKDDVAVVMKTATPQAVNWTLVVYRLHEGKLLKAYEPQVLYPITAADARWIGADLGDIELFLELTSRADSFEVGGLLATRANDKIREIVVISPVTAPRKRTKPVSHEPLDAGISQ